MTRDKQAGAAQTSTPQASPALDELAQTTLIPADGPLPQLPASGPLTGDVARSLLVSPLFGVLVTTSTGRPLLVNPRVTLLTGYPAEELQRQEDWLVRLVPDEAERDLLHRQLEHGLEHEQAARLRLGIVTRSGEQRQLRAWVTLMQDVGGGSRSRLVMLDELAEPQDKQGLHERLLASAPVALALLDPQGVPVYANGAFRSLFGAHHDREPGAPGGPAPGLLPAGRGGSLTEWVRVAASAPHGTVLEREELPLGPPEQSPGEERVVDVLATPLSMGSGDPCLLVAARDVTGRKRLEQQLRHAQKMESLGTLAGGIAHDYNNMLGAVFGFASVLVDAIPPDSPLHDDAEAILAIARRATSLTRQLMSIGRTDEPAGLVELDRVVRDTVRLLRRTIPEHIELQLGLQEELPAVVGSTAQLELCLLNLCLNARDAMPDGGRLLISTESRPAQGDQTGSQAERGEVVLTVRDDGAGIEPQHLSRIFRPFYTTKAQGTGLGLAMVQRTVREHLGRIEVESEVGAGTTMRIVLPVAEHDEQRAPTGVSQRPAAGSERVLLVDDAPSVRRAMRRMLMSAGYEVLEAGSAADALEILRRRSQIALVLLDVVLPRMGLRQVIDEIRRISPEQRVLLCSGYSQSDEVQRLVSCREVAGFVSKPCERRALLELVRQAIEAEPAGVKGKMLSPVRTRTGRQPAAPRAAVRTSDRPLS